ncbi:PadR family transcriptional regulator [Vibrio sp. 99-8-1]|uniref:PadR family transcriptional regulator n=1 Tax=Vibrio sp. 99-8-1 TaxID=2607602 RepID=UPI001493AB18|nr:PadR family transcriptional regulator [Vibrio sp. 99-8-1]NOI66892.1 PadR family transcriptional regulator [Vibrio sp. 99-8-1]
MNLPTLILAAIEENDGLTGYDITKMIKEKWHSFWSASHQQVYRDLSKLEQIGFATTQIEPQSGKPDRIKYSLTPAGKKHLAELRHEELQLEVTRDKLAVLLFASNSDEVASDKIHAFLTQCEAKQAALLAESVDSGVSKIYGLIIKKQLFKVEADINWAKEALDTLSISEAS